MESHNRVRWVYAARNQRELREKYDQWAKDYEEDLERDFAYRGPQVASEYLGKYVSNDAKILDAGAGTGLVGEIIFNKGFTNLIAMDMSEGMLAEARKKNVYQELHQMTMGEPLSFVDNVFDSIISVGVMTEGHAPASSLDELVRITKPGGYIIYTLRTDIYENGGFKEKQKILEDNNKWELVEVSEPISMLPKGEPELHYQIWVYRAI